MGNGSSRNVKSSSDCGRGGPLSCNVVKSSDSAGRGPPSCRLVLLGLDSSGKTTILNKLGRKPRKEDHSFFSRYNEEFLRMKETFVFSYDVGGREAFVWRAVARKSDGVVLVVDASKPNRFWQVKDELVRIMKQQELYDRPLLVLCNKQDLPNAKKPSEIAHLVGLTQLKKNRVAVTGCTAITGDGLLEGLDWLYQRMNKRLEDSLINPEKRKLSPHFTRIIIEQTANGLLGYDLIVAGESPTPTMRNRNSGSLGNITSPNSGNDGGEPPSCKITLLGLYQSGKTTIFNRLNGKKDYEGHYAPRIITQVLQAKWFRLGGFEVGGREDPHGKSCGIYARKADGIIFVVDAADLYSSNFRQAKDCLAYTMKVPALKHKPLLVFCNKQDKPNARKPMEIAQELGLSQTMNNRVALMGCSAKTGDGIVNGFEWLYKAMNKQLEESIVDPVKDKVSPQVVPPTRIDKQKSPAELLGYDPTEAGGNPTLKHFSPIKRGTECPFAKSAKLWGGYPTERGSISLEKQAEAHVPALAEFVQRFNSGKSLDGFCIELDDKTAREGGPKEVGECTRRMLLALSEKDPAGEGVMKVPYIGERGWRFRFSEMDIFITTFAPCYLKTSSRYGFGSGKAFVLLQPHESFSRHKLPMDTPETNWDDPQTIRDKIRVAFRKAGRGYFIPDTTKYPSAPHIVKPLLDDGINIVRWWLGPKVESTATPSGSVKNKRIYVYYQRAGLEFAAVICVLLISSMIFFQDRADVHRPEGGQRSFDPPMHLLHATTLYA